MIDKTRFTSGKPFRLFIQIPCLNEEQTLPDVVRDLPRSLPGIDEIYLMILDDGSSDRTVEVARELGVDFILHNESNQGLAKTFRRGLEVCLARGADIIVNTDGDNQYRGECIERIVAPIVAGRADLVVGCRDISGHPEFSPTKKFLQHLGTTLVRYACDVSVSDATSGFRAINRHAALRLCLMSHFSYTIEMLAQTARSTIRVMSVPVDINPSARESRLFRSTREFVIQQAFILLRTMLFVFPLRFFSILSGLSLLVAAGAGARLYYHLYLVDAYAARFKEGTGVLFLFAVISALLFAMAGLLGSVLSGLRYLLIDIRSRQRELALHLGLSSRLDGAVETAPCFFRWQGRGGSRCSDGETVHETDNAGITE